MCENYKLQAPHTILVTTLAGPGGRNVFVVATRKVISDLSVRRPFLVTIELHTVSHLDTPLHIPDKFHDRTESFREDLDQIHTQSQSKNPYFSFPRIGASIYSPSSK